MGRPGGGVPPNTYQFLFAPICSSQRPSKKKLKERGAFCFSTYTLQLWLCTNHQSFLWQCAKYSLSKAVLARVKGEWGINHILYHLALTIAFVLYVSAVGFTSLNVDFSYQTLTLPTDSKLAQVITNCNVYAPPLIGYNFIFVLTLNDSSPFQLSINCKWTVGQQSTFKR